MAIIKKFRIKSFKKDQTLLELKNISKSFGERKILDNVSLKINRGEILGLLGPNGAGKSTIFNLITGLIKPDFGKVIFGNKEATNFPIYLRTREFKIGYVPQYGGFFSDLSTYETRRPGFLQVRLSNQNIFISRISFHSAIGKVSESVV